LSAFVYEARDELGKRRKGVIQADNARAARAQLRQQGLLPEVITASRQDDETKRRFKSFTNPMRGSALALLTRQLATLIQAGMPIDEALKTAALQTERASAKRLILDVRAKLVEGHSLANSLAIAPNSFNTLYRSLVKAGEASGLLGQVLEQLADYLETSLDTQQKLAGAMVYPIILMIVATAIVVFLMTSVVPDIVAVFVRSKQELPGLTQAVIGLSNFIIDYGWFLLVGVILAVVGIIKLLKHEQVEPRWHKSQLRLPVIGKVIRSIEASRYASTLNILVRSGVNLVDALKIATQVMTNRTMKAANDTIVDRVIAGSSLFRAMEESKEFPLLLVHMVGSGERSGELAPMLAKASTHQERELNGKISAAITVIEPLMILLMGGIVLTIVLAVLMPMLEMNNMVKL